MTHCSCHIVKIVLPQTFVTIFFLIVYVIYAQTWRRRNGTIVIATWLPKKCYHNSLANGWMHEWMDKFECYSVIFYIKNVYLINLPCYIDFETSMILI